MFSSIFGKLSGNGVFWLFRNGRDGCSFGRKSPPPPLSVNGSGFVVSGNESTTNHLPITTNQSPPSTPDHPPESVANLENPQQNNQPVTPTHSSVDIIKNQPKNLISADLIQVFNTWQASLIATLITIVSVAGVAFYHIQDLKPYQPKVQPMDRLAIHTAHSNSQLEALRLQEYQMYSWVQTAREKGIGDARILQLLTQSGWPQSVVWDALRKRESQVIVHEDYLQRLQKN